MARDYYVLDGKKVKPAGFSEWVDFLGPGFAHNIVRTQTPNGLVSTRFRGVGDKTDGDGPLVFATTITGGTFDKKEWRDSTYEKAVDQHRAAIEFTARERNT